MLFFYVFLMFYVCRLAPVSGSLLPYYTQGRPVCDNKNGKNFGKGMNFCPKAEEKGMEMWHGCENILTFALPLMCHGGVTHGVNIRKTNT